MTQKNFEAHVGLPAITAGQLIQANLDLLLSNDTTAPVAIDLFEQTGFDDVFHPE